MKLPKRVLRGSVSVVQAVFSLSVTRMLRNLYIVNGLRSLPTRSCRNRMGPGLLSLTPMAVTSMTGLLTMMSSSEPTISIARLITAQPMLSSGVARRSMSLLRPTTSMVGWAGIYSL